MSTINSNNWIFLACIVFLQVHWLRTPSFGPRPRNMLYLMERENILVIFSEKTDAQYTHNSNLTYLAAVTLNIRLSSPDPKLSLHHTHILYPCELDSNQHITSRDSTGKRYPNALKFDILKLRSHRNIFDFDL